MLLLAGLHLFQLHVPVILHTSALHWPERGGQRGPWMLLFVIAPEVATSTHKDYVILPGVSAGPHCHLSNMPASASQYTSDFHNYCIMYSS